jgi:hypothetical protein
MTIPHTFRVTRDFDLYGTAKAFPRMSRHGLSLPLVMRILADARLRPGPREGKGAALNYRKTACLSGEPYNNSSLPYRGYCRLLALFVRCCS